jgi:beta-phosphoglucomutase-like phosphatase (HAD superfamily)
MAVVHPQLGVVPELPALGAVFDLDGTLLDTEPLYFEAYTNAARTLGKEYSVRHELGTTTWPWLIVVWRAV